MTRSIGNHLSRYKGRHQSFSGDKVHPRRGDPSTYSGLPPKALNDSESVSGQRIRWTNRSQHLRDRRVSSEFALLRTHGWYLLARPSPGLWSGQRQLYYRCCTFSDPDLSPITFNLLIVPNTHLTRYPCVPSLHSTRSYYMTILED